VTETVDLSNFALFGLERVLAASTTATHINLKHFFLLLSVTSAFCFVFYLKTWKLFSSFIVFVSKLLSVQTLFRSAVIRKPFVWVGRWWWNLDHNFESDLFFLLKQKK
jgi:hypothetical protein